MTTPAPLPTEPLLTLPKLAIWAQENPLSDAPFAELIIEAVTRLIRQHGDPYWTLATLPGRASDIGYIVAKDYYLNPTQIKQESAGPLQESKADNVLRGLTLGEDFELELQGLAGGGDGGETDGLWAFSFTRGAVETHQRLAHSNVVVWDTRYGWPIEYLHGEDADAMTPEVI